MCTVVRAVSDVDLENNQMTAANIAATIEKVIDYLQNKNVQVICVVADNASNMRAAEKVFTKEKFILRCGAHVVQLMVKDLTDLWQSAFDISEQLRAEHPTIPASNETRWNSKFRQMQAALPFASAGRSKSARISST
jgi:hypothetical protein